MATIYPANFIGPVKPTDFRGVRTGNSSVQNPNLTRASMQQGVLGVGQGPRLSTTPQLPVAPQAFLPDFQQPARDAAAAELASLNTQFDEAAETLNQNLGSVGTQKANTLSSLGTQLQGVRTQVDQSRQNSIQNTEKNTQDALSTAQEVERGNRNKLRALGILNSSAAGELLSKPLNEYDKQRASLLQSNQQRLSELDTFMDQKTAEHADAVRQIESQYTDLVANIQRDLRFNERQRADAVRSANAALKQRIAEIQQAQFNYATQVDTMKRNFAMQLSQVQNYSNPTYNQEAFAGLNFNPQAAQGGQTAQIIDPRKKLTDPYS